MNRYELLVFLHVGGAVVWVGAAFAMALLQTRAVRLEPARAVLLAREGGDLGPRLYLPSNLLVLVSGILLVEDGNWSFSPFWIRLGFAGFLLSFLMGALFFAPGGARIAKLVQTQGVESPEVHARIARMLVGAWLDIGLLAGVIFVMVVKPTSSEVTPVIVLAAIVVGFTALGYGLVRAGGRRTGPRAGAPASATGARAR